ncbi:hypothetical protein ACHWQZ_G016229 [Mnemiopsis leidyi]
MPPKPLSLIRAIIMGPPGSGKGTVSSRIVTKFIFHHISSGDILRHHIRSNTELGLEAQKFTSSGLLVPDNLVTKVVLAELNANQDKSWLLDGYPRTVSQAEELDRNFLVGVVLNLDVPFDTITERISKRWIHPGSGRTYNLDFNPPVIAGKDDVSGEDLVQREDDKPESVTKRLELYSNMTKPLLDYYSDQDKVVSFSGTETNVIWPHIKKYLEEKTEAMGKHGFLTPKAIGNRIKAKGLQKLKFYCQMCQKQCRDENGFKCHTMSESHQRQLLLFADNSDSYLDQFSLEFKDEYVGLLKRRFNGRRVNANHAYQEYICDRDHVHMNSTQWETLTEFVKWLGREGIVKADETEKGWFVTYIDRDPEAIARAEKKNKMAATDEERQERLLLEQMERAKARATDDGPSVSTVLQRDEESEEKVVFAMPKSIGVKKVEPVVKNNALQVDNGKVSKFSGKKKSDKKRSAIEELIAENEAGKKEKKEERFLAC